MIKFLINNKSENVKIKKKRRYEITGCIFIIILVVIGTFPENDWSYTTGIDSPLSWIFSYFFENNPELGKHIIFPHGPLAFFMYPLPATVLLTVFATVILKAALVLNIYYQLKEQNKWLKWIIITIAAYGFSVIANFNNLILINVLLLYCNYFISHTNLFKYAAFFLTAVSLFVKAYIAIVSGLLFISFVGYWFYMLKNWKQLLADCCFLLGLMLTIWILMYKSVAGFPMYIWGMVHLAQDNSSAAAYYPYNNWWILTLFFLLIGSVFLVNRTKKSIFYLILIALGLFATWKHAMAREDGFHVHGLFVYIIACLLVFILFLKRKIYLNIALSVLIVFVFSINQKNAFSYRLPEYKIFRGGYFMEFVTSFSNLKRNAELASKKNSSCNRLPEQYRETISNSTVDIYPWDYSIIAANNLNWVPRVVIQSYASYTSWLDEQNANHFNSDRAPDYFIWELDKVSGDVNGGDMSSIDDRYLLNDEPQTIIQLLNRYDYDHSNKKFLILKKRTVPASSKNKNLGHVQATWGEWIDVPHVTENLVRANLNFKETVLQKMKSFFYKDEQFWIYLKLSNGIIHKYKIVPKNARDGLWINPYVFNSNTAYQVEQIMFKCSMQSMLTDKLTIDWQEIKFEGAPERVQHFFNIKQLTTDSVVFCSLNTYEQKSLKYWTDINQEQLNDEHFSGKKSHLLKAGSYSSTFKMSLDSIAAQDFKISAECWIKSPAYKLGNKISLILAIDDENSNILWQYKTIDGQLIDQNTWNNIYYFLYYKKEKPHCSLVAYVFNDSNEDVLIDDFRIMILKM